MSPVVDAVDPGEALQQRALAAAVAPDDAEELALGDLDVMSSTACSSSYVGRAERVQRALLERRVLLVGQPEGLADLVDRDGDRGGLRAGSRRG